MRIVNQGLQPAFIPGSRQDVYDSRCAAVYSLKSKVWLLKPAIETIKHVQVESFRLGTPLWSLSQCQPSRKSNCTSLASGLYELHWLTIMPLGWYESHQVSILIPAEFGTLGTKLHLSVKSNIQSKGQKLTLAYPPNWFSAWSVDWNRLSSKVNSSYHHAFKACLPITKAGQPIGGQRKPRNSLRDDIWWTMEPRSPHIIYP